MADAQPNRLPDAATATAATAAATDATTPLPIDLDDARPRRWGWGLLLLGLGGFLAWALTAPLDAGVSSPGTVVVTGNRKAVQPLVGGKIAAVLAKDGDLVQAGQVLVRLDATASRAQLEGALGQWYAALATEARLAAERLPQAGLQAGIPAGLQAGVQAGLQFPPGLAAAAGDARAQAAIALQRQLYATRRQALASELAAMADNLRGLALQVQGTEASREAKHEQLRLLRQQLAQQRALADEGFLPRNRVLDQERSIASLVGAVAEDTGTIGRSRQAMAEQKSRMAAREQAARQEVEAQLADAQREASTLSSRLDALQFEVANADILAPASGLVMGLAVHTVGGVVAAGSPMMDVVPAGQALRIDVQIAPHLIDKVRPGLAVDILFPAFNQASTPRIAGRVVQVSADVLVDARQNLPYFKATVEVTPEGMASLQQHEIRAGMPAEVFVRTGERTAMNYLLKPLRDRLAGALTEP